MSDAELIQIINETVYLMAPHPIRTAAQTELHSREKKRKKFTDVLILLTLVFTIAIFILTLLLVLKECF